MRGYLRRSIWGTNNRATARASHSTQPDHSITRIGCRLFLFCSNLPSAAESAFDIEGDELCSTMCCCARWRARRMTPVIRATIGHRSGLRKPSGWEPCSIARQSRRRGAIAPCWLQKASNLPCSGSCDGSPGAPALGCLASGGPSDCGWRTVAVGLDAALYHLLSIARPGKRCVRPAPRRAVPRRDRFSGGVGRSGARLACRS